MGCDIHIVAQKRDEIGNWVAVAGQFSQGPVPFDWRSYAMFGFLAGVRNYSAIIPIAEPRGLPSDFDTDGEDGWLGDHSHSWLGVDELMVVDYDQIVEDRRFRREIATNLVSGAETCDPGEGEFEPLREFLGAGFVADLAKLKELGAERIVFGFDS